MIVMKLKNKKWLIFTLITAFIVCSFSFNTVHAAEVKNKDTHHNSHHSGQTEKLSHVSEHHLLTQPEIANTAVVLPSFIIKVVNLLDNVEMVKTQTEIINNQGAPPLLEPLKVGVVNSKIW